MQKESPRIFSDCVILNKSINFSEFYQPACRYKGTFEILLYFMKYFITLKRVSFLSDILKLIIYMGRSIIF